MSRKNIGYAYSQINNINDLQKFCAAYTRNQIHQFFLSMNGSYLASKHGENCPSAIPGATDIRRVLGAGLKVLSGTCKSVSEQTKFCADLVIKNITKNGFNMYNRIDGIISYLCLTY